MGTKRSKHTPATKFCALEVFEISCSSDGGSWWFHAPYGEQCRVSTSAENESIAVECAPDDRARVIEALSTLLDLMRGAP
jgi:hypothetical protein